MSKIIERFLDQINTKSHALRFLSQNPGIEHSDDYEHSDLYYQMNILMNILIEHSDEHSDLINILMNVQIKIDLTEMNQITSRG
jgi:hypothetical protein